MSLFLNKHVEPKVHLSTSKLVETNQMEFRLQFLAEVLKYQDSINQKLTDSIESISSLLQSNISDREEQNIRMESTIENQQIVQKQIQNHLQKIEAGIYEKLDQITGDQMEFAQMVNKEDLLHQAILAQLGTQEQSTLNLLRKMNEFEMVSQELSDLVKNQLNNQNEITSKLDVQDVYHQTVMERLDQQEAVSHKVNRQLDSLKAVIFERIGHLAEKIELQSKHTIKSITGLFFKTQSNKNSNEQENNLIKK
ncbi:MAG: hypothetical protein K0S25_320 [Bacillus sp. (in: firmicutes)]|nr:hypothetical protein [Bacillus sp. (in: firmicutes)]